ncbi:MAG: PKD domain-containing protein [Planctomycetia bacterium]|nr:PKD domain-containing protein [Planctomycetia bacterium]
MMSQTLLVLMSLIGAEPVWQAADFSQRAIVEIAQSSEDAAVDVAAVKVLTLGRCRADGFDLRVFDAAGKPVPFQVTFLDAAHSALISFRASDAKAGSQFVVYFGNAGASRAAEQINVPEVPGAGAPQGDWVPHAGLVLTTKQRPEGDNPKTIEEFTKLWSDSVRPHGARYQRRISDGFNPFGSSDDYLSAYRGWLKISAAAAGTYQFCTASNEASFSFLDGKELIHWPGRHTEERGIRGEKNVTIELTAGLHFVEYYHEEVTLRQVAFLGWRTPASGPAFEAIPESVFVAPHTANVVRYESKEGIVPTFEPTIVDSLWPENRSTGQFTRVRFRADHAELFPAASKYRWDFADGQNAEGAEAEHVYLALGRFNATLTVTEPSGRTQTAKWPLDVYEIQHVTDDIGQGHPTEYAKLASTYDPEKLDATHLREFAHVLSDGERSADAIRIARRWLEKFKADHAQETPAVQRLLALNLLRTDAGVDAAIAAFEASLTADSPLSERLDSLTQVIRLLGSELEQPDRALQTFTRVEQLTKGQRLDEEARAAYRRAIIAAADARLWQEKLEEAQVLYRRAELVDGKIIPPQVKAARMGAYPQAIREFLETEQLEAALDVINQWDETFPTEKPKGHTLFWRGKASHLRGQHRDAARWLAKSIRLTTGAAFETEARWLRCASLLEAGQTEIARKELVLLAKFPLADRFTQLAKERLLSLK